MSADELVIFPPSSVAGIAAIRYRIVPVDEDEDEQE